MTKITIEAPKAPKIQALKEPMFIDEDSFCLSDQENEIENFNLINNNILRN